jgi:hypothetical protein
MEARIAVNCSARDAFVVALPQPDAAGNRQCVIAPVCRLPGEPNRDTLSSSAVASYLGVRPKLVFEAFTPG